ncbi:Probable L,D-transpeptidase YbiS precursor [Raoultella planticola]|uniref:Probable L,D-transpeptidase YbiS n=1 Tax=Raoultella planticola TaxID=575 RepID=A0A485AUE6_RAOPL|nr:Probable L,D-transpeptidase YbiS precursor [Raoultella planticola]
MRSHLLAESSDKGLCGFATAHDMKNMKISTLLAAAFALVGFCNTASAVTYPLPTDGSRLIGQNQVITVPDNNKQPLEYFAAKYQMGLSNMLEANPGVDTYLPKSGTVLNIPQQLILPDTVHEGIVINSAEMRLYYYPKGTNTVIVLPIGIGQLGKDTPIKWVTKVERKKAGPTWTPTAKMHAEYIAAGNPLPAVVPAGLTTRWVCMRCILVVCTRSTAPTLTSVSDCASATAASVCVTKTSNSCLRMCRSAPASSYR